jgi:hypothetical protein
MTSAPLDEADLTILQALASNAEINHGGGATLNAKTLLRLISDLKTARKSATYWKADNVRRARLMTKMRNQLIEGARELEDEGGRVYFGNTNHADDFREFVEALDDLQWEKIIHDAGERDLIGELREARERLSEAEARAAFQARVAPWMDACFGPEISADRVERNDRFLEEALELVQASGCDKDRAHALVEYVFGRPQGDINQEVGGVMVTLAAHCLAHGVNMHAAAETELARIWTKVEAIREKQAAKPRGSAMPMAWTHPAEAERDELKARMKRATEWSGARWQEWGWRAIGVHNILCGHEPDADMPLNERADMENELHSLALFKSMRIERDNMREALLSIASEDREDGFDLVQIARSALTGAGGG